MAWGNDPDDERDLIIDEVYLYEIGDEFAPEHLTRHHLDELERNRRRRARKLQP